jgi:hypothetical protein
LGPGYKDWDDIGATEVLRWLSSTITQSIRKPHFTPGHFLRCAPILLEIAVPNRRWVTGLYWRKDQQKRLRTASEAKDV